MGTFTAEQITAAFNAAGFTTEAELNAAILVMRDQFLSVLADVKIANANYQQQQQATASDAAIVAANTEKDAATTKTVTDGMAYLSTL